jgi:hypothetical protein
MNQKITKKKSVACIGNKMETGDHSKNGVILKNQMSKVNVIIIGE